MQADGDLTADELRRASAPELAQVLHFVHCFKDRLLLPAASPTDLVLAVAGDDVSDQGDFLALSSPQANMTFELHRALLRKLPLVSSEYDCRREVVTRTNWQRALHAALRTTIGEDLPKCPCACSEHISDDDFELMDLCAMQRVRVLCALSDAVVEHRFAREIGKGQWPAGARTLPCDQREGLHLGGDAWYFSGPHGARPALVMLGTDTSLAGVPPEKLVKCAEISALEPRTAEQSRVGEVRRMRLISVEDEEFRAACARPKAALLVASETMGEYDTPATSPLPQGASDCSED